VLQLLTVVAIACVVSAQPVFAAPPDGTPASTARSARVRPGDSRSAVLLTRGLERSATIRGLVNQLERRDVIVYIEMQPSLKKRLAGTLTWITKTKEHRYVRVSINPDLNTEMAISTVGHELQHALEVANAPQIVSEQSLASFYQLHGQSTRSALNGWDTEAARQAGDDVRRELAIAARTAVANSVAESIQQLDPEDWLVVYRRARGMLPP
jgi:hypothetical protein